MINNINLILPLLTFNNPDEFYMLYVFKRKKDQPEGEKENSQSVRTIKTYCIKSYEYLEKRMPEIIQLCEMFKARAYIHINKQTHQNISLLMLERLAQRIRNGVLNQVNLFDSVVGELHSVEKRWIVDVDSIEDGYNYTILAIINSCQPEGEKLITIIPTLNGNHFITKPFNTAEFAKLCDKAKVVMPEIQKHNPSLLYLPDSLT